MVRKKRVVVIDRTRFYGALIVLGILLFGAVALDYIRRSPGTDAASSTSLPSIIDTTSAKIILVKFHGNAQCQSCINLGQFAEETINNNFEQQKESGQIAYRNINMEETPNDELVLKVQPTHASLYLIVNADGKERFEELVQAWYYTSDQSAYEAYLTPILNRALEG